MAPLPGRTGVNRHRRTGVCRRLARGQEWSRTTLVPFDDDILTEHADEAAGLWSLRQALARRPQMRMADLAEHDERIEAHLDGLRLAGGAGWRIASEVSAQAPGPGSVFVLAALACEAEEADVRRSVIAKLVLADPTVIAGVVAGFTWVITPRTTSASAAWWQIDAPSLRQSALGIDVASGRDPAERLTAACTHTDAALRERALHAAGELGRSDLLDRCRKALTDAEPACRSAALWSLVLLGGDSGTALRTHATRVTDRWAERLVDLGARRLPRATVMDWLNLAAAKPEHLRHAVQLAGGHGDPLVMPWLLMQLHMPVVARLAGQAFSQITGVDLEEAGLTRTAPAGFHAGPTDDPADSDVAPDPDEYLPWPDAAKLAAWWKNHADSIPVGVRHLLGRPLTSEHLDAILRSGTQPQRAAAAIERAVLASGSPLFDVLAPAERQLAFLSRTNVASSSL